MSILQQMLATAMNTVTGPTWKTGPNLVEGWKYGQSVGTFTAGLVICGVVQSMGPDNTSNCSVSDGVSWWTANAMQYTWNAQQFGACGTQAAALIVAGYSNDLPMNYCAKWNGTNWTAGATTLSTSRWRNSAAGSQLSAITMGGTCSTPLAANSAERYNGTTWSVQGPMSINRLWPSSSGTGTAAMVVGGSSNTSEKWQGYWATDANLPVAMAGSAQAGAMADAFVFGGSNSANNAYKYSGTAWSTSSANTLAARTYHGGHGGSSSAVSCGGTVSGSLSSTTERLA